MPAAAVASFTPAISGMSGTSVGARGETAVDIGDFRLRGKGAALYHLHCPDGRGRAVRSPYAAALRLKGSGDGLVKQPKPVVMGPCVRRDDIVVASRRS